MERVGPMCGNIREVKNSLGLSEDNLVRGLLGLYPPLSKKNAYLRNICEVEPLQRGRTRDGTTPLESRALRQRERVQLRRRRSRPRGRVFEGGVARRALAGGRGQRAAARHAARRYWRP